MSALADRLRGTAERLIARYGTDGVILRTASGGMPWEPNGSAESHPCRVLIGTYDAREVDGTLILSSDVKLLLPATSTEVEPIATDRIRAAGIEYQIVSVQVERPDGSAILYTVQGRR